MEEYSYELNLMDDPLLPFRICHRPIKKCENMIPNWHENTEVLYCSEGSGHFICNGHQYAVAPGDIVVVNSEMLHSISTDDTMAFCYLILDRNFCEDSGIPTTKLVFQELIQSPSVSTAFLRIYDAYGRYEKESNYYEVAAIRAAVLDFLYLLCRDHVVQESRSAVPHRGEFVKTAVIYIKKHLSESLTLDQIANHAGVNKYYLSRLFTQVLGKTVFETVRMLRCNEAKHRIEQGMSVTQAAHSCGFENLSHFTQTFKKYYGFPPSHCERN